MNKKIIEIWILGLALRLIFMVSSCHFDLLCYYWYAHFLPYYGHINACVFGGFVYYRPLFYLLSGWLFITKGLINGGVNPWPAEWFINNQFNLVNLDRWVQFVADPQIQWILFVLKIPYLLAEISMIFLVLKMVSKKEDKNFVLKFLLFNPVSLFSIYIFGSDDVFIVLLIVLSIFLFKRNRGYLGIFTLACSVLFKGYSAMFLPFYAVLFTDDWLKRVKLLFVASVPFVFIGSVLFLTGKFASAVYYLSQIPQMDYLFSLTLPFIHMDNKIYLFLMAYVWLVLYCIYDHGRNKFSVYPEKLFLVLALLIYSLCFFHPQYFLMIVPLMALQAAKDRSLAGLFYVLVVCFIAYTWQWGRDMTTHLFLPLNVTFFSGLRSPLEFVDNYFPVAKFFNIFRTVFITVSFWIVYQVIRHPDKSSKQA